MTLIGAQINHKDPNFIMETQLIDDSSFLYEWKTAEEDLEFLDYTYCFEGKTKALGFSVRNFCSHLLSVRNNCFAQAWKLIDAVYITYNYTVYQILSFTKYI
jgi:hypothetical protein